MRIQFGPNFSKLDEEGLREFSCLKTVFCAHSVDGLRGVKCPTLFSDGGTDVR